MHPHGDELVVVMRWQIFAATHGAALVLGTVMGYRGHPAPPPLPTKQQEATHDVAKSEVRTKGPESVVIEDYAEPIPSSGWQMVKQVVARAVPPVPKPSLSVSRAPAGSPVVQVQPETLPEAARKAMRGNEELPPLIRRIFIERGAQVTEKRSSSEEDHKTTVTAPPPPYQPSWLLGLELDDLLHKRNLRVTGGHRLFGELYGTISCVPVDRTVSAGLEVHF